MNHPKTALAAALAIVTSLAGTASHGAIILTSSQVALTSSAYARADHITDSDAEAIDSGPTPATSFDDGVFSYAMASNTTYTEYYPGTDDAYFDERTVSSYALASVSMTIDALVNTDDASINIVADTSAEGFAWMDLYAEHWRSVEGSIEAVAHYSALFTLTSAADFQLSFNDYDYVSYVRLQSADLLYFLLTEESVDPISPAVLSGLLPAGEYQFEVMMDCSGSFAPELYGHEAGYFCGRALDASFQLSSAVSAVPVPAALPLFLSGLAAFVGVRRRKPPVA